MSWEQVERAGVSWEARESWEQAGRLERAGSELEQAGVSWEAGESWE